MCHCLPVCTDVWCLELSTHLICGKFPHPAQLVGECGCMLGSCTVCCTCSALVVCHPPPLMATAVALLLNFFHWSLSSVRFPFSATETGCPPAFVGKT